MLLFFAELWGDDNCSQESSSGEGSVGCWVITVGGWVILVCIALIGLASYLGTPAKGPIEDAVAQSAARADDVILEDVGAGEVIYFKETADKVVTIERVETPTGYIYVTMVERNEDRLEVSTEFVPYGDFERKD